MSRFVYLASLVLVFATVGIAAPPVPIARTSPQSEPLLLTGGTLIDGTGAPARPDTWIRIEGDRIAEVGQGAPPAPPGARVLRLEGKTLLPGLSDMHVHLGDLSQARWMLKLLLAHGVTNVKEAGNRLGNLAGIRQWMEDEAPLPHVALSGVTINGSRDAVQFLAAGRETQQLLEDNRAFGVDFLKIHNFVSSEALRQIATFAEGQDVFLTGHVPLVMTSVAAIDAGMKVLEHVRLRPHEVLDDPELVARFAMDLIVMRRTAYWAHLDPEGAALRRTLDSWERRKDRFFVDPTLVVQWALAHGDEPVTTEAPELALVSRGVLERWRGATTRYGDLDAREYQEAKGSARGMARFIGLAHDRGIRVLTGTDTPVNWVIPGHSLHQELALLVEGGLTPVEAIHASTGVAAEALRAPDRGTVAAGKLADLVIVDGDVAADIGNVRNVRQVILAGRLYERSELLQEAASLAAHDPPTSEDEL